MNIRIPARFQIFAKHVEMSDKDRERLEPHLGNWKGLNEVFLIGVGEMDLERLIILELMGKRRALILDRLVQRISSVRRDRLHQRIEKCLNGY